MAREDITRAIAAAGARLDALRPMLRDAAEKPLGAGTWRVRDALSHIAARADAMPVARRYLELAAGGASGLPPNIDEMNEGQIRDRAAKSVDELVEEMLAGHRATVAGLADFDDDALERRITVPVLNRELTTGEFITLAGVGHEGNHLNEIETALG